MGEQGRITETCVQVEMQEDDRAGRTPDSQLTFPTEVGRSRRLGRWRLTLSFQIALTTAWLGLPQVGNSSPVSKSHFIIPGRDQHISGRNQQDIQPLDQAV